jgi:hypothetical protein
MEGTEQLQLIFYGPKDDSVETLRKVKGAFIGELGLSVDEVKQFLESTPTVIFSTAEANEAHRIVHILQHAGALVEVGEDDDVHSGTESEQSYEFTLEFDDLAEESPKAKEPSPTRIYTLDFNPDLESESDTEDSYSDSTSLEFESASPTPEEAGLREIQQYDESLSASDAIAVTTVESEKPLLPFDTDESTIGTTNKAWNLEAPLSLHTEPDDALEKESERASDSHTPEWDLSFESESPVSDNEEVKETDAFPDSSSTIVALSGEQDISSSTLSVSIDSFHEVLFELPDELVSSEREKSSTVNTTEEHPVSSSDEVLPSSPLHETIEDELPLGSLGVTPDPSLPIKRKREQSTYRRGLFLRGLSLGFILCLITVNGFLFWERIHIEPTVPAFVEKTLENEKPLPLFGTAAERETKPQSPALKKQSLKGSTTTPFGTIWLYFTMTKDTLMSGEFSFSAQQPKPLTKEEIVEGMSPRPWLHNTEFSISSFTTSKEGESIVEGSIKLFIQQGKERFREIGYMRMITSYNPEAMQLSGTIILLSNDKQASPTAPGFLFTGDQAQGFTLEAQIPFSVQFDSLQFDSLQFDPS